jgi:hypothetical protein
MGCRAVARGASNASEKIGGGSESVNNVRARSRFSLGLGIWGAVQAAELDNGDPIQ